MKKKQKTVSILSILAGLLMFHRFTFRSRKPVTVSEWPVENDEIIFIFVKPKSMYVTHLGWLSVIIYNQDSLKYQQTFHKWRMRFILTGNRSDCSSVLYFPPTWHLFIAE